MRPWMWLGAVALCLTGCALPYTPDPLKQVRNELGVPVTLGGTVTTATGTASFYDFEAGGGYCGYGVIISHHSTEGSAVTTRGEGKDLCEPAVPINSVGDQASGFPEGSYLLTIYGGLFDPEVASVVVTLTDGRRVPADLGERMYFVALEGQAGPRPYIVQVEAFDADGASLHSIPFPAR